MRRAMPLPEPFALVEINDRLLASFGAPATATPPDPVTQLVLALLGAPEPNAAATPMLERLVACFETVESPQVAEVAEILAAVVPPARAAGRAPQVATALRAIMERVGRLDLRFLEDQPVESALAWLEALPGLNRKISVSVLGSSNLRMRALAIDPTYLRVAKRLGLVRGNADTRSAYWFVMMQVPTAWTADDLENHYRLVKTLGQRICRAGDPGCGRCPIRDLCSTGRWSGRAASAAPHAPERVEPRRLARA